MTRTRLLKKIQSDFICFYTSKCDLGETYSTWHDIPGIHGDMLGKNKLSRNGMFTDGIVPKSFRQEEIQLDTEQRKP